MNSVIDTLRFSEKLQTSGFAVEQANALARALADEMGERLATKEEIEGAKEEIEVIKEDIKEIRKALVKIEGEIKSLNLRMDSLETRFNFLFALLGLLVALELIPVVRAFVG